MDLLSCRRGLGQTVKRRLAWLACWVPASLGLAPCGTAVGGPVTFAFKATIDFVANGSPFDLPLAYQVGDIIEGRFTFLPGSGEPIDDEAIAAEQPFPIEFTINGVTVGSSSHHVRFFNDDARDDSELPAPIDILTVGCTEPLCTPDLITIPGSAPFLVRSRISLVGVADVFSVVEISGDVAKWNAMTLERELFLGFDDVGPGAVGLQATIGEFTIVPEPTVKTLLTVLLSAAATARFKLIG